jgi:hypothetical protein
MDLTKLAQFVQDPKGKFSSRRAMRFLWALITLTMWVAACVHAGWILVPIPESMLAIVLGSEAIGVMYSKQEQGAKEPKAKAAPAK